MKTDTGGAVVPHPKCDDHSFYCEDRLDLLSSYDVLVMLEAIADAGLDPAQCFIATAAMSGPRRAVAEQRHPNFRRIEVALPRQ